MMVSVADFFFGTSIKRSVLAVGRLGAGDPIPQMIQRAATGALDFQIAGGSFAQQLVAMATADFLLVLHFQRFQRLPQPVRHARPCLVPSGQTRQADTLQAAAFRLWGRGATLWRRAGGGVTAPPPLSALTMPEKSAFCPETARSMRRIFARYSLSFSLFLTRISAFRVLSALFHPLQCFM